MLDAWPGVQVACPFRMERPGLGDLTCFGGCFSPPPTFIWGLFILSFPSLISF